MVYQIISTLGQIFKQLLSVVLMFSLGIDKYEKGVIGNTAIVMGVVNIFSLKSPHS